MKIALRALSQSLIGSDDGESGAEIVVILVRADGGGGALRLTDEGEADAPCDGVKVECAENPWDVLVSYVGVVKWVPEERKGVLLSLWRLVLFCCRPASRQDYDIPRPSVRGRFELGDKNNGYFPVCNHRD